MRWMRTVTVTLAMDPAAASEPIRGVDLERYAQLSAHMLRSGLTRADAIEAFVEANGVPHGDWEVVQAGWIERLSSSEELRVRYHDAATAHGAPSDAADAGPAGSDTASSDTASSG